MTPFEKIQKDLYDEHKRHGLRQKVMVDSRMLRLLLGDYERINTRLRVLYNDMDPCRPLDHKLHDILIALYAENYDSERIMLVIMEALKPLIEKKQKHKTIDNIYEGIHYENTIRS